MNLCQQGGSKSFLELVEVANLTSPFAEGCVKSVITEIEAWLHAIDDKIVKTCAFHMFNIDIMGK